MNNQILDDLKDHLIRNIPSYGTHSYEHTMRVLRICEFLGQKMNADMTVLLPAAILHDMAREEENHAIAGAHKARSLLEKYDLSDEQIDEICHAIESHSFSGNKKPKSLEAKILSDADKLDAMGAIGVYRVSTYSGENARSLEDAINHFHDKLLNLRELIFTQEAKKLAKKRHEFMLDFLGELRDELNLQS